MTPFLSTFAHGYCLQWQPWLLWTIVVSNALIGAAFCSIPVCLIYLSRGTTEGIWSWFFTSFALFVFLCGATHVVSVIVIWEPVYWFQAALDVATAGASTVTAVILITMVPTLARALRSPMDLRALLDDVNTKLELKIREHESRPPHEP